MLSGVRVVDVHCENNCLPGTTWAVEKETPGVETYLFGDEISAEALEAIRKGNLRCGHCKSWILVATEPV